MKLYTKIAGYVLAALLVVGVAACGTVNEWMFGKAETPAQQAFQEKAKIVYASIPVHNYLRAPDPNPGVADLVCVLEQSAYDAGVGAADAALAGGDDVIRILAALSGAMAQLSLQVFDQVVVPDVDELAARSVILSRVLLVSVLEMRTWRKGYVEPVINDFAANQRDPTADEWAVLDAKVKDVHAEVRTACEALAG